MNSRNRLHSDAPQALIARLLTLNGTVVESAPYFAKQNVTLAQLNMAAMAVTSGMCTCNCARPRGGSPGSLSSPRMCIFLAKRTVEAVRDEHGL